MKIDVQPLTMGNVNTKNNSAIISAIGKIAENAKSPRNSILKGIKKDIKQNTMLKTNTIKKLEKIKVEMEKLRQNAHTLQVKNTFTLDKLKSKILKKL